jgi:hypothetical protein
MSEETKAELIRPPSGNPWAYIMVKASPVGEARMIPVTAEEMRAIYRMVLDTVKKVAKEEGIENADNK